MLKNGDVFNFNLLETKKYILLGLDFFQDRDLASLLDDIKFEQRLYPEIKDKDTVFFYNAVFFHTVFDFIPYEEYKSEKSITNIRHYSWSNMMV